MEGNNLGDYISESNRLRNGSKALEPRRKPGRRRKGMAKKAVWVLIILVAAALPPFLLREWILGCPLFRFLGALGFTAGMLLCLLAGGICYVMGLGASFAAWAWSLFPFGVEPYRCFAGYAVFAAAVLTVCTDFFRTGRAGTGSMILMRMALLLVYSFLCGWWFWLILLAIHKGKPF